MVGIVLVSHSKALAMALRDLVLQMVGPDFPLAVAAGAGDDHADLGTDAVHIAEVLRPFCAGDGAVVLMDLGSAVLSAQTALELLEAEGVVNPAGKLCLCPAPLVEAAVAAAVQAQAGADLNGVAAEAMGALAAKQAQLAPVPTGTPARSDPDDESVEIDVVIDNPHGLHVRPAAAIVRLAGGVRSELRAINLTTHRGPVSARSLTGLGLLQARRGDRVRFSVRGADAPIAALRLRQLAEMRFGEPDVATSAPSPTTMSGFPQDGGGVPVSEGIAIGRPVALVQMVPEPMDSAFGSPEQERNRLDAALRQVAEDLRVAPSPDDDAAKIFAAQALMLSDPALLEPVRARLAAGGISAQAAWWVESLAVADAYAVLGDDTWRARTADLRDIAARVVRVLAGQAHVSRIAPDPPAVLVTDDLLPSEAMACDSSRVLGVLARTGSSTSHAAIIVRTLGIPMVVAAKSMDLRALTAAKVVAIDGGTGECWIDPPASLVTDLMAKRETRREERAVFEQRKADPAMTRDGQRIEVLANVGGIPDAIAARANGADGVGLLRTEFVYLSCRTMPTEDQQARSLTDVMAPLGAGPVVVRTPDIGADKPIAFLPLAIEHNPFLGVRGLRLSFRHPEFFATNLRAILRAGADRDLRIMFPMVTSPEEMRLARACAQAAHQDLLRTGTAHRWPVKLGMMVEVPAAALMIGSFMPEADFLSIGTNDLTQYILAAERGNGDLDHWQDAAHPAVLRVIRQICDQTGRTCPVSVCGDAASDPVAAALMIGAGVRSLSVRPNQVAAIKAQIRRVSMATLRDLADRALRQDTGTEVRRLARATLAVSDD
jgi:phosphocarrier protein FPr